MMLLQLKIECTLSDGLLNRWTTLVVELLLQLKIECTLSYPVFPLLSDFGLGLGVEIDSSVQTELSILENVSQES